MEFVIKFYQKVLEFFKELFASKHVETVKEEEVAEKLFEFEYRKSKPTCKSHMFYRKVMNDIVAETPEYQKVKVNKTLEYIYKEMIPKYGNNSLKKGVFHISYALQRAHEILNALLEKDGSIYNRNVVYLAVAAHDMDKNFTGKKYKHAEGSVAYIDSISKELLAEGLISDIDELENIKSMVLNHSECNTASCRDLEKIMYDSDKLSRFPIEIGIKAHYEKVSKKNDNTDASIEKVYLWMIKKYGKHGEVKFKLQDVIPEVYDKYLKSMPDLDNKEETIKFIKEAILK